MNSEMNWINVQTYCEASGAGRWADSEQVFPWSGSDDELTPLKALEAVGGVRGVAFVFAERKVCIPQSKWTIKKGNRAYDMHAAEANQHCIMCLETTADSAQLEPDRREAVSHQQHRHLLFAELSVSQLN